MLPVELVDDPRRYRRLAQLLHVVRLVYPHRLFPSRGQGIASRCELHQRKLEEGIDLRLLTAAARPRDSGFPLPASPAALRHGPSLSHAQVTSDKSEVVSPTCNLRLATCDLRRISNGSSRD